MQARKKPKRRNVETPKPKKNEVTKVAGRNDELRLKRLQVMLTESDLARLDQVRGTLSRSSWCYNWLGLGLWDDAQ